MRANFGVNTLWFHGGRNWFGLFVYSAKTCAKGPRGNSIESKSPLADKVPVVCSILFAVFWLKFGWFCAHRISGTTTDSTSVLGKTNQNRPALGSAFFDWPDMLVDDSHCYVLSFLFGCACNLHRVVIGIHVFSTTEQHSTHASKWILWCSLRPTIFRASTDGESPGFGRIHAS